MKTSVLMMAIMAIAGGQLAFADCGSCSAAPQKAAGDKNCADGSCAAAPAKVAEVKQAEVKEAAVATLKVEALATMIKAKTPMTILDARAGKWDDGRRIPGARNLTAESAEKDIAAVIPDKDALVITYCTNLKCQASPKLAKHLRELGYKNVIELPEGIDGWEAAGQKVDRIEKK